jgi:excisionase family DNA binding protein
MREDDWLTISVFSELLHVHPNTTRRMIRRGRINALRPSERVICIPASELARLSTAARVDEDGHD